MGPHNEPAARIITLLGGVTEVAARTSRDVAVVRRWRLPEPVRAELLAMAGEKGVDLSYADFAPQPAPTDSS